MATSDEILSVLDACCDRFTFPMLDNGYVYLACTRLSLYRSASDWAMVIEVFGFSPRAFTPDVHVYTFGSRLHHRDTRERYVSSDAYDAYLARNPNNESRFYPSVEEGDWQDPECADFVASDAIEVGVRGRKIAVPTLACLAERGIVAEAPPRIMTFELSRYLAEIARNDVLAEACERRGSVPPELTLILELDEWHHPDVADDENRPSTSETFRQLARVLETGDVSHYRPTMSPNTHWTNWPGGGRL